MSAWNGLERRWHAAPSPEEVTSKPSIARSSSAHKPLTKQQRVLRALLAGPTTSHELERPPTYDHCANSTVSELRKQGIGIHTERITVPGYAGQAARIARYHILPESRAAAERIAFPPQEVPR